MISCSKKQVGGRGSYEARWNPEFMYCPFDASHEVTLREGSESYDRWFDTDQYETRFGLIEDEVEVTEENGKEVLRFFLCADCAEEFKKILGGLIIEIKPI